MMAYAPSRWHVHLISGAHARKPEAKYDAARLGEPAARCYWYPPPREAPPDVGDTARWHHAHFGRRPRTVGVDLSSCTTALTT